MEQPQRPPKDIYEAAQRGDVSKSRWRCTQHWLVVVWHCFAEFNA